VLFRLSPKFRVYFSTENTYETFYSTVHSPKLLPVSFSPFPVPFSSSKTSSSSHSTNLAPPKPPQAESSSEAHHRRPRTTEPTPRPSPFPYPHFRRSTVPLEFAQCRRTVPTLPRPIAPSNSARPQSSPSWTDFRPHLRPPQTFA